MIDSITDWLDMNRYGGLKGISTTHVLVDMVVPRAKGSKAYHVVLMDYNNAFDNVEHTSVK